MEDKEIVEKAIDALNDLEGVSIRFDLHEKIHEAAKALIEIRRSLETS